jgi:HEAT repeat protein
MTIDPDQIRHELVTLLAHLPDPEAPDADIEAIASRLDEAHNVLVQALQSVERTPVGGTAGAGTEG